MSEKDKIDFDKEFEKYLQREDNRLKAMSKLADIFKNVNISNYIQKENTNTIKLKKK